MASCTPLIYRTVAPVGTLNSNAVQCLPKSHERSRGVEARVILSSLIAKVTLSDISRARDIRVN